MRSTPLATVLFIFECCFGTNAIAQIHDLPSNSDQVADHPQPTFEQRQVIDKLGRQIKFYVSKSDHPKPLMLFIQGSGCEPVFVLHNGWISSSIFGLNSNFSLEQFVTLAVDKPYSKINRAEDGAVGCGSDFNNDFSADRWLVALLAALREAENLPQVDRRHVYVVGQSEGAEMAADVAGHAPEIDGVVFAAGSGNGQAFDMLADALADSVSPTDAAERMAETEKQIRAIMDDPKSTEKFAWGHSYLRWSSFFQMSALDELRQSHAKVYVVSGTADRNSPFISNQTLVAGLLSDHRAVFNRVIPDGNHSLQNIQHPEWSQTEAEFKKAFDWIQRP